MKKELLNRFFKGNATKAEIEQIVEYLYSDEVDKDLQKVIADELEKNENNPFYNAKENFNSISEQINTKNKVQANQSFNWWKLAAAIILLAISTFVVFIVIDSTEPQEVAQNTIIKDIIKTTEKGQKLQMKLPDGTHVVLNAGSSIKYTQEYGREFRNVYLSGEAYFEVVEDTLRPFIVNVNSIKVSVLGTSFNVNNRENSSTTVALVEGKVLVEDQQGASIIINPGEMIKELTSGFKKSSFDYRKVVGWKDGWLTFDQDPFTDIKNTLELWYGVQIQVEGKSAEDYHYTGKFNNKSLEEVLKGISYVMDFDFDIDYDQVNINFN